MIIDGHLHLDHELGPDDLVQTMDRGGIDKAVLFSGFWLGVHYVPDWLPGISRTMLSSSLLHGLGLYVYNSLHRRNVTIDGKHYDVVVKLPTGGLIPMPKEPDNEPVARARDKYPERFVPFVFLNAQDNPELMKQFEKWVDREGFRGVKIHTWSLPFDLLGDFLEVARAAESRGIPLLMHMGGTPESSNVEGLLAACPGLKLILAHAGIPFFARSEEQVKKYDNLYLDLSGPYLASASFLKKVIARVGAEKLIFGSDGLWGLIRKDGAFSYDSWLSRMKSLSLPEQDLERIMSGTIKSVAGIK